MTAAQPETQGTWKLDVGVDAVDLSPTSRLVISLVEDHAGHRYVKFRVHRKHVEGKVTTWPAGNQGLIVPEASALPLQRVLGDAVSALAGAKYPPRWSGP